MKFIFVRASESVVHGTAPATVLVRSIRGVSQIELHRPTRLPGFLAKRRDALLSLTERYLRQFRKLRMRQDLNNCAEALNFRLISLD